MDPPRPPRSAMFRDLTFRPRITTTTTTPHRRRPSVAAGSGISKRKLSKSPTSPVLAFFNDTASVSFFERMFGEEYPEAFSSGDGFARKTRKRRKTILDLPTELLDTVVAYLSKLDIKRLRLSSKRLANKVDLRIDRVYISPNRANLGCLRQIVNHPRYSKRVREVVWDDAQLEEYPTLEAFKEALANDEKAASADVEDRLQSILHDHPGEGPSTGDYFSSLEYDDFFDDGRLSEFGKGAIMQYRNDNRARNIVAWHASKMSIEDSYRLYLILYEEERELMNREQDAAALRYVLSNFPNLTRVVLTSEVWRPWHSIPIYDSPFFRFLPPGFRKPTVWPWLSSRPMSTAAQQRQVSEVLSGACHQLPKEWRGYSIIVSSLLAVPNHKVDEFIVDVQHEPTGISWQLFAAPNEDYARTLQMMQTIPLTRLQFAINSVMAARSHFSCFLNGLLKQALESLTHLQHLDLNLNMELAAFDFPLEKIFPEKNPTLQHLTLRNVCVENDELYDLLATMPRLASLYLHQVSLSEDYTEFFSRIHENMQNSDPDERLWKFTQPRFAVAFQQELTSEYNTKYTLVDREIDEFVYGDDTAESPWHEDMRDLVREGIGWMLDLRDPEYMVRGVVWPAEWRARMV